MTGLPIVPPLVALVLFAAWGLLLVVAIGLTRMVQVVTQGKGPGDFPAGTPHGSPGYWRLNRAHLNVTENLPFFGALVLSGMYLQVQGFAFEVLPSLVLYARIAQSLIHVASGSRLAVTLRFICYLVQVLAMLTMAAAILKAAGLALPW